MKTVKHTKKAVDKFEVLSVIYLLLLLLIILITAMAGDHTFFLVIVGFFPTILVVLISLTIHEQYIKQNAYLWILPILVVGLFYFVGLNSTLADRFDIAVLTGVNFLLSVIYVLFVFGTFKKHVVTKVVHEHHHEAPAQEEKSLQDYVHSIEDKSKALNFVVGRVYNKYHGGTQEMREKLRIPADWYNEFSLIGIGTDQINFEKLSELIARFELQLKNFEKTELELFKSKSHNLKNLIRNIDGSEKIIDVLDHNDKDPVRSYYEGAVGFCTKIREAMQDEKVELVKNEYIPKTEEEEEEIEAVNKPGRSVQPPRPKPPRPFKEEKKPEPAENKPVVNDNEPKQGPTHP